MSEFNLSVTSLYSNHTDDQLDGIVEKYNVSFQHVETANARPFKVVAGRARARTRARARARTRARARAKGLRICQQRVRVSQTIDPEGSVMQGDSLLEMLR